MMKELDQYLCLSQDKEDSQPQLTLHEDHMKALFKNTKKMQVTFSFLPSHSPDSRVNINYPILCL